MAVQVKQYVEVRGDNPLMAVVAEQRHKAYLVANLAINDSIAAAAQHYGLSLAEVHGAIAFYYENEALIHAALQTARAEAAALGAVNGSDLLHQIRKRR